MKAIDGWKEKVSPEELRKMLTKPGVYKHLDDLPPEVWDVNQKHNRQPKESIDVKKETAKEPIGNKFDGGKLRLDLVPAEGEEGVGEAFTYGLDKYGDHTWRGGIHYGRLIGAIARHLRLFKLGEDRDEESGLLHVDSITANAMMLSTFLREGRHELDDRYKPGDK